MGISTPELILWLIILLAISVFIKTKPKRKPKKKDRKINQAELKGQEGEKIVNRLLEKLGDDYTLFQDIYVPYEGRTSQIDHVLLSPYGIFVIETKNFSGWIYGKQTDRTWTQVLFSEKNTFYNPIWQNNTHVKALAQFLETPNTKIYVPIIVFGEKADFKFETNFNIPVIKVSQLTEEIKKHKSPVLSPELLRDYQKKLATLVIEDSKKKQKIAENHVKQLQK